MDILSLLSLLEKNARMDVQDLATALQTSKDNVLNTMSELERQKVICGYHTVINYHQLYKENVLALIQIDAKPEREFGYDRIASHIYQYDEVDSMYLVSGSNAFLVVVSGKTMLDIATFVASKLAVIDGVNGTSTHFVLKQYKNNGIILEADNDEKRLVMMP